jgi:hypothetical protein
MPAFSECVNWDALVPSHESNVLAMTQGLVAGLPFTPAMQLLPLIDS